MVTAAAELETVGCDGSIKKEEKKTNTKSEKLRDQKRGDKASVPQALAAMSEQRPPGRQGRPGGSGSAPSWCVMARKNSGDVAVDVAGWSSSGCGRSAGPGPGPGSVENGGWRRGVGSLQSIAGQGRLAFWLLPLMRMPHRGCGLHPGQARPDQLAIHQDQG